MSHRPARRATFALLLITSRYKILVEMSEKLRILLAEDHKTVREGIKLLVNAQTDMEVIGEAGDGEAAVQARGGAQA